MLVTLCSAKGSPGVTTLACLMGAVWTADREAVVAECDPSGNDLAPRFGLSPRRGMTSLVLGTRAPNDVGDRFDSHIQHLPGGLGVLAGPCSPEAARMLDIELGRAGADVFPIGVDVLIDCGRILAGAAGQHEMLKASDRVLVVVRPDSAGLAHGQRTIDLVRALSPRSDCSFVAVGPSEFAAAEMERALSAALTARIPLDHRTASIVCGSPGSSRALAKSGLVRSARVVVDRILSCDIGYPTTRADEDAHLRTTNESGDAEKPDTLAPHDSVWSTNGHGRPST
jgi:MinD-like ATPase involved in chromosome partitioning or flagellar assembly